MTLPLEKQVSSLELSKKLKELGVKQESLFCWQYFEPTPAKYEDPVWNLKLCLHRPNKETYWEHICAFTVAELGEMLPDRLWDKRAKQRILVMLKDKKYYVGYECSSYDRCREKNHRMVYFEEDTEADARAKMLIYLLEKKLIKL